MGCIEVFCVGAGLLCTVGVMFQPGKEAMAEYQLIDLAE